MTILGDIVIWSGVFFMIVTTIGLLRLPDFYARLHAVSKTETLGLVLIMVGLGMHAGASLVFVKLLLAAANLILLRPNQLLRMLKKCSKLS